MKRLLASGFVCALLAGLTLFLWSCGDDDGGPADGGQVDSDPPGVQSVNAGDSRHIVVVFDERVDKATAEHRQNYIFVETAVSVSVEAFGRAAGAVGDTLFLSAVTLGTDGRTATATSEQDMANVPYAYSITGIKDVSGNVMSAAATGSFTGSTEADLTAPEIVSRSPSPNATGVQQLQPVIVQFSEPMNNSSVASAFSWTWSSGIVSYSMTIDDGNTYVFTPAQPLALNTLFTVSITSAAEDLAGNDLAPAAWSFRTTSSVDNMPPRVLSTVPADGATNVSVGTNLQITFSERINEQSLSGVILTPNPGDGVASWSADGRTVTFDPDQDLEDDTQYTLVLPQGAVEDLAGNPLAESYSATFTTAAALASGRISGTIEGDADSDAASDPQGAIVVVSNVFIFDYEGDPPILGTAVVAGSGNYTVQNLVDGTFWPVALMETNGDGILDPEFGDAVGAYGVDLAVPDLVPDSVVISGGNHVQNVDFPLFDPSAISGMVFYDGTDYVSAVQDYDYYVGAFDTTGFDPQNIPSPDYSTQGYNLVQNPQYVIDQFDNFLGDGVYYIGGYVDVNTNGDFDPAVDPAGFYGSGGGLTPVTIVNGSDGVGIDIHLDDPAITVSRSSGWSAPENPGKADARMLRLRQLFRKASGQIGGQR
jgi:hypothetical protein